MIETEIVEEEEEEYGACCRVATETISDEATTIFPHVLSKG
jgi:hypothetical protein